MGELSWTRATSHKLANVVGKALGLCLHASKTLGGFQRIAVTHIVQLAGLIQGLFLHQLLRSQLDDVLWQQGGY